MTAFVNVQAAIAGGSLPILTADGRAIVAAPQRARKPVARLYCKLRFGQPEFVRSRLRGRDARSGGRRAAHGAEVALRRGSERRPTPGRAEADGEAVDRGDLVGVLDGHAADRIAMRDPLERAPGGDSGREA